MSLNERLPLSTANVEEDEVMVRVVNRCMVITLNRPRTLNALTIPMIRTIYEALKEVRDNNAADLVLMKSSSERAFCAGGDVLALKESVQTNGTMHKMFYIWEYLVDYMIGCLPVPFVALISGVTMGAGCGLSVNGRFRVATERTLVAMPEVGVGLLPDAGATYVLPRLPNQLGMFMALTGARFKGADAWHSGMATHYMSSTKLAQLELQLLALKQPTIESVGRLLNEQQEKVIPPFSLAPHLLEINQAFSAPTLLQVVGELETSGSDFGRQQLAAIAKMNPISLKVTFHQLRLGRSLEFADVFALEYRLIQRLVTHPNFLEGCRALLIDKDHNAKWVPASIHEVSDLDVQQHYQLLPNEFQLTAQL